MNNKKIKVGIIGYGVVGQRRKNFIIKNKLFSLVSISDIKFKKKLTHKKNVFFYKHYDDLLRKSKIDAAFITLPNYLAAKVTSQCLKKNIHVFCEKPPARSLAEIKVVKKIKDKKKKLILKYGFNHRCGSYRQGTFLYYNSVIFCMLCYLS